MSRMDPRHNRIMVMLAEIPVWKWPYKTPDEPQPVRHVELSRVQFWDDVTGTLRYECWVPPQDEEFTEEEIECMKGHCKSAGITFQLRLPPDWRESGGIYR